MVDHFKVLGVSESCSSEDVKHAYIRLAKLYHPDANKSPGSTERFRVINASYEVLKDEKKRAGYVLERGGVGFDDNWSTTCGGNKRVYNRGNRDASADFDRAADRMYGKGSRTRWFMEAFEKIIHPRTLFIILPSGLFTYWGLSSLANSSLSNKPSYLKSDANNVAVKMGVLPHQYQAQEKVDAWKNPKTDRWETPAPWDAGYKKFIAAQPLQKVDKTLVYRG